MELAQRKRGDFVTMDYIDDNRVNVIYQIPLAEIVFDFFDNSIFTNLFSACFKLWFYECNNFPLVDQYSM